MDMYLNNLLTKFNVFLILLVELQFVNIICAPPELGNVANTANRSAENMKYRTARRRHTGEDNNAKDFEFLVTSGYRPKDKSLVKYLASLRLDKEFSYFGDNHDCGSAIIARRTILTAAHCVNLMGIPIGAAGMRIVTGTPKRLKRVKATQVIKVAAVRSHSRYKAAEYANDIAILTLAEDINIDGINADIIEMSDKPPVPGTVCTAIGWGNIIEMGPMPDEAIWGDLTILTDAVCKKMSNNKFPGIFCAQNERNHEIDVCQGDSGGPLICNNKLVGIVSFAIRGCGNPESASGFSDVHYFRNWIENASVRAGSYLVLIQAVAAAIIIYHFI